VRRFAVLLAAAGIAVLLAASGTAGTSRGAAIKPGKGIGKVELGMTLAQVKRALGGPPFSADRRTNFGARGRYIEYTWEVGSFIIHTWHVGLRSTRRNGPLRVVRVGTGVPGHRTPQGLGVGSRARDIVRVYPGIRCEFRHEREKGWYGTWMFVVHPGGAMTAFNLEFQETPGRETALKVIAVLVQRSWLDEDDDRPGVDCPNEYLTA
jgi:hypothetical protein